VTWLGHFLFRYRNALFPCAFALVLLPGRHLFAAPRVALGVGAMLALLGEAVRMLTIGLEYIIRGGRNRRVYAEGLVTEGLYAHCRNPMYVGNLLVLTGIAVASNSWTCLAVAVPLFTFFYVCIVAAEEEFLRTRFGATYDAYARDVPRWQVQWRGLAMTLRCATFHWRRVLMKEYGTACALIGGLCLLGLVSVHQSAGVHAHDYRVFFETLLAVTVVAWLLAWGLKRSHVIVAD
jgi:protein-S-isoprenylcysteine O-methyltransferase Ste14